jgi:hypothetical protein
MMVFMCFSSLRGLATPVLQTRNQVGPLALGGGISQFEPWTWVDADTRAAPLGSGANDELRS